MEEIKKTILELLEDIKPGFDFEGRTDLVDAGDIDSFDVISLVGSINEEFDVDVPIEAIVPENFNSVEAMVNLLSGLLED